MLLVLPFPNKSRHKQERSLHSPSSQTQTQTQTHKYKHKYTTTQIHKYKVKYTLHIPKQELTHSRPNKQERSHPVKEKRDPFGFDTVVTMADSKQE